MPSRRRPAESSRWRPPCLRGAAGLDDFTGNPHSSTVDGLSIYVLDGNM
jgi:hypothetical protein